jgi:hypothetical protein
MSVGSGLDSGGRISIARRRLDDWALAILVQRRGSTGRCRAYRLVRRQLRQRDLLPACPFMQLSQNSLCLKLVLNVGRWT